MLEVNVLMGLIKEIEKLREELNECITDNKRRDNENVIILSRKLDILIDRFYAEREVDRL